jgi:hypothetical protein
MGRGFVVVGLANIFCRSGKVRRLQCGREEFMVRCNKRLLAVAAVVLAAGPGGFPLAIEERLLLAQEDVAAEPADDAAPERPKLPEPKGAKRLSPEYDIWIDPKQQAVLIDGQISLREGMLEMFACTRNTKEHESIVSANTKAYLAHAALLRLGAEAGSPVQWMPEYKPPSGTEIEVLVWWVDEEGKEHSARAQEWVKEVRTGKAMTHPFVFAGSSFWTDEATGKRYYQAEGGDFICVSNFSTAMLDIPVESSQSNTELAFEAFTERIPPLGAPVRLVLKPKLFGQAARGADRGAGREHRDQGGVQQPDAGAERN